EPQRWGRVPKLSDLSLTMVTSPSAVQTVLLAVVIGGIAIGCVTGNAGPFSGAAIAALLLLLLASRAESQAHIERQAPQAIRLMASGLKAGYSVPQALALVARESPEPTSSEFGRAVGEVEAGGTLDTAMTHLADRTSRDYALVATIVSVQHE